MGKILLEICCGSADDVFEAARAGADRVELNSAMFLGGLTPSVGTVREAKRAGLPVMAMVRPREGGFCYTEHEFAAMREDAQALLEAGADGIVFGILRADGTVDEERCARLLELVRGRPAVFHRAIDVVPDWRAALDTLCRLGFSRVLTSGQNPNVYFGAETVRAMREYAAGRIEILPGAGLTPGNAREVLDATGCTQMHIALPKACTDASTSHGRDIFFGGALYPPEDRYAITDAAEVSRLVGLLAR